MKHTHHLECFTIGKWINFRQGSLQYLQGYLDARKDASPRLAYRLMRSDGKILEETQARDDVSIGQVAGFPTAEQYEIAAKKALAMAEVIRERTKH